MQDAKFQLRQTTLALTDLEATVSLPKKATSLSTFLSILEGFRGSMSTEPLLGLVESFLERFTFSRTSMFYYAKIESEETLPAHIPMSYS